MTSIDYSHRNGETHQERKTRLREEAHQVTVEQRKAVITALEAAGHTVKGVDLKRSWGGDYWTVDGESVTVRTTIVEKSGWGGEPSGQFRYTVESHPWKETLFTKKGVLDVAAVVKSIEKAVDTSKVREKEYKQQQTVNRVSRTVLETLKKEFAPKSMSMYPLFIQTEDGVSGVAVHFHRLTEEQARAILSAAVAAGVKLD